MNVRHGWTQLLFKVSVGYGQEWNFRPILAVSEDTVIFNDPAVPETLPTGAVSFTERPLGEVLGLYSQGSAVYALSYDSTSTTDPAAVDPAYTQVDVTRSNKAGDSETINSAPFVWNPIAALDKSTGTIGEMRNDGGGYNRYFSFAMYVSRTADSINASLHHHEGIGVWFDGKYVNGHVSTGEGDAGLYLHLKNVSRGWHNVHVRLQTENGLKFVPLSSADHASARQTCAMEGLSLCSRDADICPLSKARPDIGIPVAGSRWAAVSDSEEWVQVGSGDSGTAVCGVAIGDKAVVGGTFEAACCGTTKPGYFTFSVTASSNGSHVAWAASQPAPTPRAPSIHTSTSSGNLFDIIVNITSHDTNAKIYYSTSYSQYPNLAYTGPITVRFYGIIRAVAVVDGVYSEITEQIVRVHDNYTLSRHSGSHGPDCFVQLGHAFEPTAVLSDKLIVAVDTTTANGTAILGQIVADSNVVRNANADLTMFTSFIAVDSNNVFKLPESFTARRHMKNVSIVVFESNAASISTHGTLLSATMTLAEFTVVDSYTIFRNLGYAPIPASGAFVGGDRITFPELYITPEAWAAAGKGGAVCSETACDELGSMMGPINIFHLVSFSGAETFFANTTHMAAQGLQNVNCACVESAGGLSVPMADYQKYVNAALVSFAKAVPVVDSPAPDSSRKTEIITFGPQVVSAFHNTEDSMATMMPVRSVGAGRDNRVTITGNFPSTDAGDYTAVFTCDSAAGITNIPFNCSTAVIPTARVAEVTASTMTLHVHAPHHGLNVEGLWTLVVTRTKPTTENAVVPANYQKNFFIAVMPPQPNITAANGECAHDGAKCHFGAAITFVGYNFNTAAIHRNKIDFIDVATREVSKLVSCNVVAATETSLVCRLMWANGIPTEERVEVVARVEAIPAPRNSGEVFASAVFDTRHSLALATAGRAAWSGDLEPLAPTSTTASPTNGPSNGGGSDSGSNAGTIAGVVCALLVVVGIVAAVLIFSKYDLIPKRRAGEANAMAEVEESLTDGYEPKMETV